MIQYPSKINNTVAQAVAITVFVVTYTSLLQPVLKWIMILLFAEFVLRYIHPRLSPLVLLYSFINNRILNNDSEMYYAPPKRFAVLLGIIFTGTISIAIILKFVVLQYIFSSLLLMASFLQGFFDYCIGCKIYDYLIKLGVIRDYKMYYSTKS